MQYIKTPTERKTDHINRRLRRLLYEQYIEVVKTINKKLLIKLYNTGYFTL